MKNEKIILIIGIIIVVIILFHNPSTKEVFNKTSFSTTALSNATTSLLNKPVNVKGQLFSSYSSCIPDGQGGSMCCDSGYACDMDTCGPTQGWCDNYKSGGRHCKSSDNKWCCYNSGDIVCSDDSNICGSQSYCDRYSSGKSCVGDKCCPSDFPIIDFSNTNSAGNYYCCGDTTPFFGHTSNGGTGCFWVPTDVSDDWYTKASNCKGFEQTTGGIGYFFDSSDHTKYRGNGMSPYSTGLNEITTDNFMNYLYCSGRDLMACKDDVSPTVTNPYHSGEKVNTGIYHYVNAGRVLGKCGVQCVGSSTSCNNTNTLTCQDNSYVSTGPILGSCGVECLTSGCKGFQYQFCQNYKLLYPAIQLHIMSVEPITTPNYTGYYVGICGVQCLEDYCDGKNFVQCNNYTKVNKGKVIGSCGVECTSGNLNGYTCIKNNWINSSQVNLRNYLNTTLDNYYRFDASSNSCTLINLYPEELTDNDYKNMTYCEFNIDRKVSVYTSSNTTVYSNVTVVQKYVPAPFDFSRFTGITFILIIIGIIGIFFWRRKK